MEQVKVLHHLIVTVMCFVCFGFSVGTCLESDVLIKSYVESSSLPSGDLLDVTKLQVQTITESDWDSAVLGSQVPVMVMFTANWCGPCRSESSILSSLESEYTGRFKFYSVDAYEDSNLVYRYNVGPLPTIIVFKGGDTMAKVVGAQGRDTLKGIIEQYV